MLEILSWKVKQGTSVAALQACGYPTRAKVFAVVSSTYWEAGMQVLCSALLSVLRAVLFAMLRVCCVARPAELCGCAGSAAGERRDGGLGHRTATPPCCRRLLTRCRLLAWEGSRGEHEISNPLSAVIWVCFATTVLLNLQVT